MKKKKIGRWEDRKIGSGGILLSSYPPILLLTLLFNFATVNSSAQILPPAFLCVTNDTLRWEVPTNTCGTFVSYRIFASQDQVGPYTILDTTTNQNQTSYFHENAGTNRWFYYLQSNFNCPGQPALSSDTLDNRIPEQPRIRFASVEKNGTVQIAWNPSPSPEAYAYIISKNTPSGTAIIDTVVNGFTYLDINANADERSETYYVVTLDRCGNTSLIPAPHITMLLKATGASACDRSVQLAWQLYKNWQNPIEKHEIWVSENGAEPKKVGEAAGNAITFTFQNASANIEYCFSVRAIESGTGNAAASSQACLTLDVVSGVNTLIVTNATVTADNQASVSWIWNIDAQIKSVNIQRSFNGTNFSDVNTQTMPPPSLNRTNTFGDDAANTNQSAVYYQIKTVDACNAEVISNKVATIFLRSDSKGTGGENLLRWTAYINENATNIIYELYRAAGNAPPVLVSTVNADIREYTDKLDLSDPAQATACYFILAKIQLTLPDGTTQTVESRSNNACSSQDSKIYIPNAFAPNGVNREFRPYLQFGEPTAYLLSIYDRWGGKLFETRAIDNGWDGRSNGKDAPQGVYTYLLQLTQSNGEIIETAGSVLLLR